jgi:pSer/pThr/pTyr-binding forkhead associated (FHA) protein
MHADDDRPVPTHLLAGTVAYALNETPLTIGAARAAGERGVVVDGALEGVSRRHCSIVRRGDAVVVEDHSRYGTFVNDRRISDSAPLKAGDVLRVGTPGSEFLLLEARD